MENNIDPRHTEDENNSARPVEHDYAKHENDPGPSPQAVKEENDKGAGPVLKWIIPIIVIVLAIIYWIYFRHSPAK